MVQVQTLVGRQILMVAVVAVVKRMEEEEAEIEEEVEGTKKAEAKEEIHAVKEMEEDLVFGHSTLTQSWNVLLSMWWELWRLVHSLLRKTAYAVSRYLKVMI
jgi:hypothetical protein